MRILAWVYTSLAFSVAAWTWCVYASVPSNTEHLLPVVLLSFVSLPLSLTLELIYTHFEVIFWNTFVQLAALTSVAIIQAAILHVIAGSVSRASRSENAA